MPISGIPRSVILDKEGKAKNASQGAAVVMDPFGAVRALVGGKVALQGNLDPIRLLGPFETAVAPARRAITAS